MATYHVIGLAPAGQLAQREYWCMNKREMAQAIVKARDEGLTITHWYAQTRTGERMLGNTPIAATSDINLPKLVDCPICDGNGCCVCNYSGVTQKNYWRKWSDWQLESIRRDALKNQRTRITAIDY